MTNSSHLPEYVHRLAATEDFTFSCHTGLDCFTDCCRMLELALTPYDVLRLRRATSLTSQEILDRYVICEHESEEPFPRFYLAMVDDGRAGCVFVSKTGCRIYPHRPSACRAYPLGRAAIRTERDNITEHFVILKEKHCLGFHETKDQTPSQYCEEQGLDTYNTFNDAVAQILQHDAIRQGFMPSKKQVGLFTMALYNLDTFRTKLVNNEIKTAPSPTGYTIATMGDEELLYFAISWLKEKLFSSPQKPSPATNRNLPG